MTSEHSLGGRLLRPSRTSSAGWLVRAARFRRGWIGEIKNENKHVDAFREGLGDAGSTPATSTNIINDLRNI